MMGKENRGEHSRKHMVVVLTMYSITSVSPLSANRFPYFVGVVGEELRLWIVESRGVFTLTYRARLRSMP